MDTSGLKKIVNANAAEICRLYQPSEQALQHLDADVGSETYLGRLLEDGLFADAAAFLAQALPNREATWWACLCVRATLEEQPADRVLEALNSAERWVYKPTEEHRRAAMGAAEASGFDNPAAWAGVAAFWSEGSMAPPDAPAVPAGPELNGRAVIGAVMLAAVRQQPELAEQHYARFLEQGLDVARGGSGRV